MLGVLEGFRQVSCFRRCLLPIAAAMAEAMLASRNGPDKDLAAREGWDDTANSPETQG